MAQQDLSWWSLARKQNIAFHRALAPNQSTSSSSKPQPLTSPESYALLAPSRLLLPIVSCVQPIAYMLETLSGSPFSLASSSSIQQTPIHPSKPSCHCPLCILLLLSSINYWVIVAQMVKSPPTVQETPVQSLGQEDPLEKEMATHSSILAWRIPGTEEPGGLQSIGSQRVGYN